MQLANQAATPVLWPTPTAAAAIQGPNIPDGKRGQTLVSAAAGESWTYDRRAIAARLWPTPSASNPNDGESVESWTARRARVKLTAKNGNGMGTPLSIVAKLWPTPTVHGNDNRVGMSAKSGDGLGTAVRRTASPSSAAEPAPTGSSTPPTTLNPRWVEWLMGFPDGWTDCGG